MQQEDSPSFLRRYPATPQATTDRINLTAAVYTGAL